MRNGAMLILQLRTRISLAEVDALAMHVPGGSSGLNFTEFTIFYGRIVSELSYEVKEDRA